MRKIIALLLSATMVISLFGCGKASSTQKEKDFEEDKFNITVACQVEEGETTVMAALEKAYEEANPDVNIIVKDFGGHTKITDYITAYASTQEKLPMVVWMDDAAFAEPAEGGYFVDLRPYYEMSEETSYDKYYNSMLQAASYTGEYKPASEDDSPEYGLYFAPRDYNKPTIVYNKTLLANLGVEIPDTSQGWNMEQFYAFLQSVNSAIEANAQNDRAYRGYRVIRLFSSWEPIYTTIFANCGTDGILKADNTLNLDSAKNTAILDELYENILKYEYMVDNEDNFNAGTTCMTIVSRPLVVGMANQLGSDNIDFLPFPGENVAAGCSGYGITAIHADEEQTVNGVTKKVSELAWDFIKFIITEEGQQVAGKTGLGVPVLKSLTETGTWCQWNAEQNMNHGAFLSGGELQQTTFNGMTPYKRTQARYTITGFFSFLEIGNNGEKESRDAKLADVTKAFNAHVAE